MVFSCSSATCVTAASRLAWALVAAAAVAAVFSFFILPALLPNAAIPAGGGLATAEPVGINLELLGAAPAFLRAVSASEIMRDNVRAGLSPGLLHLENAPVDGTLWSPVARVPILPCATPHCPECLVVVLPLHRPHSRPAGSLRASLRSIRTRRKERRPRNRVKNLHTRRLVTRLALLSVLVGLLQPCVAAPVRSAGHARDLSTGTRRVLSITSCHPRAR